MIDHHLRRLSQLLQAFFTRDITSPLSLHRADDRGRAKFSGKIDHAANKIFRAFPLTRIGIRQQQLMLHPAGPGADGGEGKFVFAQQFSQLRRFDRARLGWENLNTVKADFSRLGAGSRQIIPEYERAAPGFLHERYRYGTFHDHFPMKTGRRWRSKIFSLTFLATMPSFCRRASTYRSPMPAATLKATCRSWRKWKL